MKRRIIHQALICSALLSTLLLTSCSTTQSRIQERPQVYQSLSATDQALVQQGRIREGMSQDTVYLAWGEPSQRGDGRNRGRTVETWIYFDTTTSDYYPSPLLYGPYAGFGYGYGFGGGFGYRHTRRGRYYRAFYDPFYDPFFYSRTTVLRYPERTVSFQNGRVIAYQYLPRPRFY